MKTPFSEALRTERAKANLTLRVVGERAGFDSTYVHQLETGRVRHPTPATVRKLAAIFPSLSPYAVEPLTVKVSREVREMILWLTEQATLPQQGRLLKAFRRIRKG